MLTVVLDLERQYNKSRVIVFASRKLSKSLYVERLLDDNTFNDFQRRNLVLSAAYSHFSGDTLKQLSFDHPEQLQVQRLLRKKLTLSKDGILHRKSPQGDSQIVVPIALVAEVLRPAHDNAFSGHQSVKKTLTRILDRFWWSTVNKDVMEYTKSCHTCGERMPSHQRAQAPLKERRIAEKSFERVEIDIKEPLPRTDQGSQLILVIQDAFYKYVELCPLQRQTTEKVSCKIQECFGRYGLPEVVNSNNGTFFTSRAFEQFFSQHGILSQRHITPKQMVR